MLLGTYGCHGAAYGAAHSDAYGAAYKQHLTEHSLYSLWF